MGHPLKAATNAELIFQVGTGVFYINPADGNEIEQFDTVKVIATMKIDEGYRPQDKQDLGANTNVFYLTGNVIDAGNGSKFMPSTIAEQQKGKCTITDPATGNTLKGNFVITSLMQSRWKQVTKALGSSFSGYLIRT
jgi:hypothetical protein